MIIRRRMKRRSRRRRSWNYKNKYGQKKDEEEK